MESNKRKRSTRSIVGFNLDVYLPAIFAARAESLLPLIAALLVRKACSDHRPVDRVRKFVKKERVHY